MTKTTGDTGNDKLKHSIGIINPRHDAIFIASDVKHHSAVLEDACAADRTFYILWRCPIGAPDPFTFLAGAGQETHFQQKPFRNAQMCPSTAGAGFSIVWTTDALEADTSLQIACPRFAFCFNVESRLAAT
jgi:hypothetical protein